MSADTKPIVWVGSVMRENLEVDGNIAGIVFVTADSFAGAVSKIQSDTKKQAYFKPGKSVIRVRSLFPLLELGDTVGVIETHELNSAIAGPSAFSEVFLEDAYVSHVRPPRDDLPPEGLVLPTKEEKLTGARSRRRAKVPDTSKKPADSVPESGGRRRRRTKE